MATNLGDLSVELKLDIRPYAESIKTALLMAQELKTQTNSMLNLKTPAADFSKIDNELNKLQSTLINYSSQTAKAEESTTKFASSHTEAEKSLVATTSELSIAGIGFSVLASKITDAIINLVQEAGKLQKVLTGLNSAATFRGIDPEVAQSSVRNLEIVRTGLISLGEAAMAYRNLISAGFNDEQAVTLLNRFGDAAAFGRKNSMEFGQSIVTATEGVKDQNSTLLDNIGITKNLSTILKEQGGDQGDLNKLTSDSNVRWAIYNGILKETNGTLGDTAKLTNTLEGRQANLNSTIQTGKEIIGTGFLNAILNTWKTISELSVEVGGANITLEEFGKLFSTYITNSLSGSTVALRKFIRIISDTKIGLTEFFDEAYAGIPILDALNNAFRLLNNLRYPQSNIPHDESNYKSLAEQRMEEERGTYGHGHDIPAEEGSKDTSKPRRSRGGKTEKPEKEDLSLLQEIDKQLAEIEKKLILNKDQLGATIELETEKVKLIKRRREITGEALLDTISETAELKTQREQIERIVDEAEKKNKLFEKIVKDSQNKVIDSKEFKAAKILFTDIADLIRNQLGQAWKDVFGEANSLAEIFIQNLIQKFLDMALQFALQSILSSIFPLAGIIPSFFGGGGASPAGTSLGGSIAPGLGNSIEDFIARAPSVQHYERSTSKTEHVPYIAKVDTDGTKMFVMLKRVEKQINRRSS